MGWGLALFALGWLDVFKETSWVDAGFVFVGSPFSSSSSPSLCPVPVMFAGDFLTDFREHRPGF